MECPQCGHNQETGNFCAECGTSLQGACPSCDADLVPGARFCTGCGEPVAGRPAKGSRTPYLLYAGAAVLGVAFALLVVVPRQQDRAGPGATSPSGVAPSPTAPAEGNGAGPGPLSADMRTNADRLFNRVMAADEQGNQEEVAQFMPMAIQAYNMVEDLDADGVYHLGLLHLAAGEHDEAREAAERTLETSPDHVLALGVAGQAAAESGDDEAARQLYRRLLDAYPDEAARSLPEYQEHQRMLPEYRRAAEDYLDR